MLISTKKIGGEGTGSQEENPRRKMRILFVVEGGNRLDEEGQAGRAGITFVEEGGQVRSKITQRKVTTTTRIWCCCLAPLREHFGLRHL